MTTTVKAVYENGVFRPVNPIDLPEGTPVEFTLTMEDGLPDAAATAAAMARIAALPHEGDASDQFVSENHDHYLYGAPKRQP